MKRIKFVCGWKGCKKTYSYTASYSKHLDKAHPEIAKTPIGITTQILSPHVMSILNKETELFIGNQK